MPGRYSHSVVLADYSSRGIISLPPDQHSKYVNSAPPSHQPLVPQFRVRDTRSAQAVHRDLPGKSLAWPSTSDRPQANLSNRQTATGELPENVADRNGTHGFQPKRYSRCYELPPESVPVVDFGSRPSQPELRKAYRRQQDANSYIYSMPSNPPLPVQGGSGRADTRASFRSPPVQELDVSPKKNTLAVGTLPTSTGTRITSVERPDVRTTSSARSPRKPLTNEGRPRTRIAGRDFGNAARRSENRPKGASKPADKRPRPQPARQPSSEPLSDQSPSLESGQTLRPNSRGSKQTQIWNPRSPAETEPNFDAFADVDEAPSGHFDAYRPPAAHSHSVSLNSALLIQQPESSDRPTSRGQRSDVATVASPKNLSPRNGNRGSPSRTTESGVKTSTRGQRSNGSVSSVSVLNGHSHLGGVNKRSSESPRKVNNTTPGEPSWRLPEIQEDHGFSPSIFEDREGHNDQTGPNEFDPEGIIGRISSGKDITFDNSDAASDLSAALPPPITRFRDEEDEFNANMSRLFGQGGDYAIAKKGSHTMGWSATKKTKGFFSKFRSRSQPPDK